jgi:hypothetical protein
VWKYNIGALQYGMIVADALTWCSVGLRCTVEVQHRPMHTIGAPLSSMHYFGALMLHSNTATEVSAN